MADSAPALCVQQRPRPARSADCASTGRRHRQPSRTSWPCGRCQRAGPDFERPRPAAHQTAVLACPRLRPDDGGAVVVHAGVPDAGAHHPAAAASTGRSGRRTGAGRRDEPGSGGCLQLAARHRQLGGDLEDHAGGHEPQLRAQPRVHDESSWSDSRPLANRSSTLSGQL